MESLLRRCNTHCNWAQTFLLPYDGNQSMKIPCMAPRTLGPLLLGGRPFLQRNSGQTLPWPHRAHGLFSKMDFTTLWATFEPNMIQHSSVWSRFHAGDIGSWYSNNWLAHRSCATSCAMYQSQKCWYAVWRGNWIWYLAWIDLTCTLIHFDSHEFSRSWHNFGASPRREFFTPPSLTFHLIIHLYIQICHISTPKLHKLTHIRHDMPRRSPLRCFLLGSPLVLCYLLAFLSDWVSISHPYLFGLQGL